MIKRFGETSKVDDEGPCQREWRNKTFPAHYTFLVGAQQFIQIHQQILTIRYSVLLLG